MAHYLLAVACHRREDGGPEHGCRQTRFEASRPTVGENRHERKICHT